MRRRVGLLMLGMLVLRPSAGGGQERNPPPDVAPWRRIEGHRERLHAGLNAIYAWYERNADLIACVLRDAEVHRLTREIAELRLGPHVAAWQEVLGVKLKAKERAMLRLALSFFTWRTLVREAGLKCAVAVEAMVEAIECGK